MITSESFAFQINKNDLYGKIHASSSLSMIDIFDIFRVLGMVRICSWQEFQLFSKPTQPLKSEHHEYASQYYYKTDDVYKYISVELYGRINVERNAKEIIKKTGKENTEWVDVVRIHFENITNIDQITEKLRDAVQKINDDYDFIPNLWAFKWERADGTILTDSTVLEYTWIEPKCNIHLDDLFKFYFEDHKGTLYRLFNDAVRYENETATMEASYDEEEEEDCEDDI